MEATIPLGNPHTQLNELNLSKLGNIGKKRERTLAFTTVNDGLGFDDEDNDAINIGDNPFTRIWDDDNEKRKTYKESYPKDDSFTDSDIDSTDTEPTDTDLLTSSSELSIYKTTTDTTEVTESIDPNTAAQKESSPSYHPSEDDSDESTDSEYFDSDAETGSSERTYTSYSENVDDSPDTSPYEESQPEFPPMDGGPPETFKWSSDEQMEIPVKETKGKTIDPFEAEKQYAREKMGAEFVDGDSKGGVFENVVKHVAPSNSFGLEDWSEMRYSLSPRGVYGFENMLI